MLEVVNRVVDHIETIQISPEPNGVRTDLEIILSLFFYCMNREETRKKSMKLFQRGLLDYLDEMRMNVHTRRRANIDRPPDSEQSLL